MEQSGSSPGSYPGGRRFKSGRRNLTARLGYNDDWTIYPGVASIAKEGGAEIGRFGVSLQQVAENGWDYSDRLVGEVACSGLEPLVTINGPIPASIPRVDWPQAYANFAGAVAERYPGAILEGWNEPNLQPRFGDLRPREAGRLYRAAAKQIGERKILSPALAPHGNWKRYLREMRLPRGAPLAIHPYPSRRCKNYVESIREQVNFATEHHREVWVTEVGISTGPGQKSLDEQRDLLVRIVAMLRRKGVQAIVIHRLIDPTHWDASDWESGCGTLRGDRSPKPSYHALRKVA